MKALIDGFKKFHAEVFRVFDQRRESFTRLSRSRARGRFLFQSNVLMITHVDYAQPDDAGAIAAMVGELLHEIMAAVPEKTFGFHQDETTARAHVWMQDGAYTVLLARDGPHSEPFGFLGLSESYALYTEGIFGTIPEFFVRPTHRSQGVGTALLTEAKHVGRTKGWRRLEVTTPPLPQFERTLVFYQRHGFNISGGRKLKAEL